MADVEFDDFDDVGAVQDQPRRGRLSRAVNWAGAATSVALVLGLAVWGYRLAVRDVSGIPVIQALEGPARVAPENPGGDLAQHQGLAVNSVAAFGEAAPAADRLRLAPRPAELAEEDAAMGEMGAPSIAPPPAGPAAPAIALAAPETTIPASLPAAGAAAEPVTDAEAARALAEQISRGAEPLAAEPLPDPGPEALPDIAATEELAAPDLPFIDATDAIAAAIAADVAGIAPPEGLLAAPEAAAGPGLARSPRPAARPATRPEGERLALLAEPEAVTAEAAPAAAPVPEALDIDPATLAAGTRLVQLGAYDDRATAAQEWDRIAQRFGALMEGKRRVIQQAESGGRTFYRLRVHGFDGVADARRFCAALLAENTSCIPAQVR